MKRKRTTRKPAQTVGTPAAAVETLPSVEATIAAAVGPDNLPKGHERPSDHASPAALGVHDGHLSSGGAPALMVAAHPAPTHPVRPARRGKIDAAPSLPLPIQPTPVAESEVAAPHAPPSTLPIPTLPPATAPTPQQAESEATSGVTEPMSSKARSHPASISDFTGVMTTPDLATMAASVGQYIESSGKAAAAYLQPRESGASPLPGPDVIATVNSLGRVAESWMLQPGRMIQAQAALSAQLFAVWSDTLARFGGPSQPHTAAVAPRRTDKRFAGPEWQDSPYFAFLHQAYLVTTDWARALVSDAEGVDAPTREKADFYLRQISSALSPSNFLATNPELLKETFKEKGENLVRGMKMLAEDIEAGNGDLRVRQSDMDTFTLGVDMAATPGKVVFRNDLMELLQYDPSTETVLKRPLLIVPPWINKFYVLDLNKEKSLIAWAVAQGLTVFVISWVNPDERHAAKDWDSYMREGIFAALDAVTRGTGENEVAAVGYCVGGTLLAATLAFMAAENDTRIGAATFLTTQVDFTEAGDLKVFADEAQIRVTEKEMKAKGFLDGTRMANAFNMLRPDDLIWSYAVNAYLKGQPPKAFDLLAWNADSTRMSAANHAFYLRNCYLENNLTRGEMVIGGRKLDLRTVTIPIYDLATRDDHIAPAASVFTGAKCFGGPVRYVLAGSGHIAGVVNPPARAKYGFWTEGSMDGGYADWLASATEHKGTWWLDWIDWVRARAPETVPARAPGGGGLEILGDAPGTYVRVRS